MVQTELKLVSHFITVTTVQSADQLYLSILAESCLKLEGMLLIVCAFLLEACIKDIVASHTYISLIGKPIWHGCTLWLQDVSKRDLKYHWLNDQRKIQMF